jgi:hypothetical protein
MNLRGFGDATAVGPDDAVCLRQIAQQTGFFADTSLGDSLIWRAAREYPGLMATPGHHYNH